ncbi:AAA family ATPase [Archangium primigenium]|uniref:AAA family ATPase n=1 Tax=[Archangium] primigenium TaxID=2792470 RepID=UPI001958AFEB|nr:AAA family ATPase [Archangium primigenium]MBM7116207.1 ATP-dependent Clp protease ATP-binding subunit [Archangium primigenium]
MAVSDAATGTLDFSTPLLCQQLWNGDYQVFPVAAPELASHAASLEACLTEQRLFLEEHLSQSAPEELARFSLPERVRLEFLELPVTRGDVPKRLARPLPIELAVVVIPFADETWVSVPVLDHTVFVGREQDVRETVRADVERLLAARELSGPELLKLLPPRATTLETLALSLRRGEPGDKARAERKRRDEKLQKDQAHEVLRSVSTPLHPRDEARHGPPLVGRDTELALMGTLVGGEKRQGVLLVGPELVGKTELLLAFMRAEHKAGRARPVFATSGSQLIAGMSGFGQWQERVLRVMRAAQQLDAILYFENLGELLAQHSTESINLPGAMKPFLDEGRVRVVGELTPEALDLLENQHPGFLAAFSRVRLEPLGARPTREALRLRAAWQQRAEPTRPSLAEDAVEPLVELAERYLPGRALPGKAVRLYEELRAGLHQERTGDGQVPRLTRTRLYSLFSLKTGVPEFLLREDRALLASDVEATFRRQLVGQELAVRRVVETLCMVKAGLQPQGKPLATFLFVGPTGVGKTELARLLATFLFGSPERLFRFDMSEFMDSWAAERLIRGNAQGQGLLTRRVRQQPFCVLLLDEIEKAHPAVFDLLLQVCGEGRLTDTRGQTAWFHNALIIMTSNLGVAHRRSPLGIGAAEVDDGAYYLREVHRHFRPEFVNRIDQLIAFRPLSAEQIQEVARLAVGKLGQRRGLLQRGLSLDVPPDITSRLATSGYHEAHGARGLRRHLDQHLVVPLARALSAAGPDARGGELVFSPNDEGFSVALARGRPRQVRDQLARVEELRAERVRIEALLKLDAAERLGEQLRFLVAQLAREQTHAARGPEAVSISRQQSEHGRLELLWSQVERLRATILSAEELALLSLYEQQDVTPFVDEALAHMRELRRLLPSVLLALQPQRDGITLIVQEAGDTRAMDRWLLPLLDVLSARGWVAGGRISVPRRAEPQRRDWSPDVLSAEALKRALNEPERPFREVLLSVGGPYAGSFLSLEAGLHRYPSSDKLREQVLLTVSPVATTTHLSEKELVLPLVAPPEPPPLAQLRLIPATREHLPDGTVSIGDGARTVALDGQGYFQALELVLLEHILLMESARQFDPESAPSFPVDQLRSATS